MGGALARAVCANPGPEWVILSNRTPEKAQELANELGCVAAADNMEAAAWASYIFMCVKPHDIKALLAELAPAIAAAHEMGKEKVLVSVAAGLTIEDMRLLLRGFLRRCGVEPFHVPILRIMPNTCVTVGRGMTALCAKEEEEGQLPGLMGHLRGTGRIIYAMPEKLMDQFTALAGCGPAFVYPFIEALADGGVAVGMPRALAVGCAAQTVLGAAAMVLESGKHPGQLKDEVCSPGGSTIAGVAELERHGLRAAAMDAVLAAYRRNQELGK